MPENDKPKISPGVRRLPQQSFLYDRIVPFALIGMGILLAAIVLFALGILLGIIRL